MDWDEGMRTEGLSALPGMSLVEDGCADGRGEGGDDVR